jgi:hypothetical protein
MITAQPVEKIRSTNSNSLESLWDLLAVVVLFLGLCTAIGLLLVPLFWGSLWGVLFSPLQVLSTWAGWLVCRSIAEHIRIQKKIAGLTYLGQISGPGSETVIVCGNCQNLLHSPDRCDHCGASIQASANETSGS